MIARLKSWAIQALGGRLPEAADETHRYVVETRYEKYYADKIECHPGGAVEWWSSDPAWGTRHRIITESGVEITDERADEN